jgi:dephospho-CoA kinase
MKRQRKNKKIVLGLTGGIGCGKTTAARMFGSFGAKVIDADAIGHSLLRPKTKTYKKILRAFGRQVLRKNKTIDRKKLAAIVFGDKNLLGVLNRILHPGIISRIKGKIKSVSKGVIVLDAPLLLESKNGNLADRIIVVKAGQANRIKRIREKTGLTIGEIRQRIRSQMPLSHKVRRADFIIDNDSGLKETRKQVSEIRRQLWIK